MGSEGNANEYSQEPPGPGAYGEVIDQFGKDGLKVLIQPEGHVPRQGNSPGPGHYNPHYSLVAQSARESRISPSGRNSGERTIIIQETGTNLGPGSYDYNLKNFGVECQTYTISQSQRDLHAMNKTPGPGTYDPHIE